MHSLFHNFNFWAITNIGFAILFLETTFRVNEVVTQKSRMIMRIFQIGFLTLFAFSLYMLLIL